MEIAVRTLGQNHVLMKVKERKNGGLIIVPSTGKIILDLEVDDRLPYTGTHYTVHPNEKSEDESTNFHAHVDGEDGKIIDITTHIRGPREKLIFPIFIALVPKFPNDAFVASEENSSIIAEYDPVLSTMNYFVFLLDKHMTLNDFRFPALNYQEYEFSKFRLGVFWTFRVACSPSFGIYAAHRSYKASPQELTGHPAENGFHPLEDIEVLPSICVSFDLMTPLLRRSFPDGLSEEMLSQLLPLSASASSKPICAPGKVIPMLDFGDIKSWPEEAIIHHSRRIANP